MQLMTALSSQLSMGMDGKVHLLKYNLVDSDY